MPLAVLGSRRTTRLDRCMCRWCRFWKPLVHGDTPRSGSERTLPWSQGGEMPLSEYEQRILKQIQGDLSADDPKLAASLINDGPRALPSLLNGARHTFLGRRRTVGAVLMLVGFVMLVGGIGLPPAAWA